MPNVVGEDLFVTPLYLRENGGISFVQNGTDRELLVGTAGFVQQTSDIETAQIGTTTADGNITLSGLQTLQGYTLQDGDIVLLTAQTNRANNRPYVARSGAWEIYTGWDVSDTVVAGELFVIENGTSAGKIFRLETIGAITLGTTLLSWNVEASVLVTDFIPFRHNGATLTVTNSYDYFHIAAIRNGAQTYTIPTKATSPRPAGRAFRVSHDGSSGTKTVTAASGVKINGTLAASVTLTVRGDSYWVYNITGNEWIAMPMKTGGAALSASQTDSFSVYIESPSDKTYKLIVKSPIAMTINSVTTISTGGTCTLTGKINTTALGGTANSVSTSEQEQTHSSANSLAVGDDFQITVSANSSCAGMTVTVKYTYTLA